MSKYIELKGLKVFVNKRTNQRTLILPRKKTPKDKSGKKVDIKIRWYK